MVQIEKIAKVFISKLDLHDMSSEKIEKIIVNGSFIMPAFKSIKRDTLNNLINYMLSNEFLK